MAEAHGLQEFHDVVAGMLLGRRLAGLVNDIVVEFANARYQAVVDRFVAGHAPVDNSELRPAWRNTAQSPLETWDSPVYENFFRLVRAANWGQPPEKQIRVLLGDPPIDWASVASADQKTRFLGQRDTHIAEVVKREVLDKGRRALIIAGGLHVFHRPPGFTPMGHGNAVFLLEHEFGQRVFVIAGSAGASDDVARRLAAYRYPAILGTSNTWLGSADAGKLLLANPYGAAQVRTVADAVLYLGPSDQLTLSYWNPAVFLDPTYWAELQRRAALGVVPVGLAHLRQERPARFSAAATEE